MSAGNRNRHGRGALELLEEATYLLRIAPMAALFQYYLGTVPFILGFLFFWGDMSCSGTANSHLIQASLGLTVLFIWMKCWQATFASHLRALLEDTQPFPWTLQRFARLVGIQSVVMPWIFIVLPLAMLIALPFGWCYAFFQSITALGSGEEDSRVGMRKAWHQCTLWPAQNHRLLLILVLFTSFVFMNLCMAAYLLPIAVRTLLGVESVFSRSEYFLLNTTFWLSMAGLTYLCVNPLIKSVYVLRCYYGESLSTGRDLLSRLRRLRRMAGRIPPLFLMGFACCLLSYTGLCTAGESGELQGVSRSVRSVIPPEALDKAIRGVIGKLDYTWRFSQEKVEVREESGGFLAQVLGAIGEGVRQLWNWIGNLMNWIAQWLEKLARHEKEQTSTSGGEIGNVKLWLSILTFSIIAGTALMIRLIFRRRQEATKNPSEQELASDIEPDLADENLLADKLPSERWSDVARDLVEQGELRLAMRAFHFGGLAHLAENNLLSIAGFKSNRDYVFELRRRAHSYPDLIDSFSQNVLILERVWYGMHHARREMIDRFLINLKRITADVEDR